MIIEANRDHIKWIVRHRIEMLSSMGWEKSDLTSTEILVKEFLEQHWDTHNPEVFLKVVDNDIVGGCAVVYSQLLPTNRVPSGKFAYILNMFVEPEHRGNGFATQLIQHVISKCKEKDVNKIALHDTEMSKRIYERQGFVASKNYYEMHI